MNRERQPPVGSANESEVTFFAIAQTYFPILLMKLKCGEGSDRALGILLLSIGMRLSACWLPTYLSYIPRVVQPLFCPICVGVLSKSPCTSLSRLRSGFSCANESLLVSCKKRMGFGLRRIVHYLSHPDPLGLGPARFGFHALEQIKKLNCLTF